MSTDLLTKAEQAAVAKAMSKIGRRGGSARSDKKSEACRKNGQLGGRRPVAMVHAEEAAFNLLTAALAENAPPKRLRGLVARWVKTADKYVGVLKTKWEPEFGNLDDYLSAE